MVVDPGAPANTTACEALLGDEIGRLGDGICDAAVGLNIFICNYDGGDCCLSTCVDENGLACNPNAFYTCVNPNAVENIETPACVVEFPSYLGKSFKEITGMAHFFSEALVPPDTASIYTIPIK